MSFHSGFEKGMKLARQFRRSCPYYYGKRARNYNTRQQLTKRLLKQAGISYSFNVLRDMKEAGISYTRRNIIKDAFERLGVF